MGAIKHHDLENSKYGGIVREANVSAHLLVSVLMQVQDQIIILYGGKPL